MRSAERATLVVCFLVCPLLFFTNLTRNPYITQIALLNAGLALALALALAREKGDLSAFRTPLDLPLAGWVGAAALSWIVAYAGHKAFFRPAVGNEGARRALFFAANALAPFFAAVSVARAGRPAKDEDPEPLKWATFSLVWGGLWLLFPKLRGPGAAPTDAFGLFWDGYGAMLWALGFGWAFYLCRRARRDDFLHLALTAGFIASVYGVLQYFGIELVWPNTLNPYGGRSVSTFGNPNFMSSYMAMMLPLCVNWFARASGGRRAAYAVCALFMEAALLCSLTRSSWLGAALAVGLLALSPELRRAAKESPRPTGLLAFVALVMAVAWPQSLINAGYAPSVIGRVRELGSIVRKDGGSYSPFHQRVLIWTCGWLMGHENPVTGKGYGLFELFYPFYQGPILAVSEFWRIMRTHANNGHNEIVETFAETGLVGLGAVVWLWTTFFRSAAERLRARRWDDGVAFACAAAAAGMLADNMLNVSLHFAVPAFAFWWLVGTALADNGLPNVRQDGALPRAAVGRKAVVWAGFVFAAFIGWSQVRVWNREVRYFSGFKLLRANQLLAATLELERSKKWGPPEVNSVYELGNAYAKSDRYPEADKTYRDALNANAGYDEIYFNVGAVKSGHLGDVDGALDFFRMAWFINPLSNEIYNSLANILLRDPSRRLEETRQVLIAATRAFPDNAHHWNNLGYIETVAKNLDAAESAYVRALTIDPTLAVAERNLLGMTMQAKRKRPAILDRLAHLRELDARVGKRDFSDATLSLAKQLSSDFPDMTKVRFLLGSLLLARGRPAEAVAPLEETVSREPSHAWAHQNLGEAYLALGRRDDAARQFRAALAIDPRMPAPAERLRQLGLKAF